MKKVCNKIWSIISRIFNSTGSYYYSKQDYYEVFVNKYNNGRFYLNLINRVKNANKIKTNDEIKPLGYNDEVNVKSVVAKYGKPNYKHAYKDLLGIEVLFFRQKIGNYKLLIELHFLNNSLFFYSYSFINLDTKNRSEIIQMVKRKYIKGTTQLFDADNYLLFDNNNNIILINDDVDFSIFYLVDTKMGLDKVKEYLDLIKIHNENKQKKYRDILYNEL